MTTATLALADFLLARIAEDEAVARAVRPHEYLTTRDDPTLGTADQGGYETCTIKAGRVLAECEAKRRVVGLADFADEDGAWPVYLSAIRALAEVYSDHPDYDEAWRP